MTKDEALTLAREALIYCVALNRPVHEQKMHAITAIKKALAQPEQEPVAAYTCGVCGVSMQMERQWVGLTDDEIYTLAAGGHAVATTKVVNSILKGKNT